MNNFYAHSRKIYFQFKSSMNYIELLQHSNFHWEIFLGWILISL